MDDGVTLLTSGPHHSKTFAWKWYRSQSGWETFIFHRPLWNDEAEVCGNYDTKRYQHHLSDVKDDGGGEHM